MAGKYLVLDEHRSPWERAVAVIQLAIELTKAELRARQFQRLLGPIWWIIEPSLMSLVFFFLTNRLNYSTGASHFMFIFIGLTVWRYFARAVENSPVAYLSYSNVIRQVSFPLLASNLSSLFTEFVFFCSGLLFILIFGFAFSMLTFGWSYLAIPLLIMSQSIFTLAVMVLVATVGVYVRDIPPPLSIGLNVAFFLSPAIYTVDSLPRVLDFLPWINPFYYYFPAYRMILLDNQLPPFLPLIGWTLVGLLLCVSAMLLYRKTRPNFLRVL